MDHCLPQIFRTRLALLMLFGNLSRRSIVDDDIRVIDRDIFDASFEVTKRVTPGIHHFADEAVSLGNGFLRIVDKVHLNTTPGLGILCRCLRRKLTNVQLLDALGA